MGYTFSSILQNMFKKTIDVDIREQLRICREQVQVLQKCLADKCEENDRTQVKVDLLRKSLSQVYKQVSFAISLSLIE